jgi:hypothetical protein
MRSNSINIVHRKTILNTESTDGELMMTMGFELMDIVTHAKRDGHSFSPNNKDIAQ